MCRPHPFEALLVPQMFRPRTIEALLVPPWTSNVQSGQKKCPNRRLSAPAEALEVPRNRGCRALVALEVPP
jgi:hypothetical protein